MKMAVVTVLSILTLTGSAFGAETKWAQGPFFKAPQATVINTKISYSTHPDLVQECVAYQSFIDGLRKGSAPIDPLYARRVDSTRKRMLQSQSGDDLTFKATFKVEGIENFRSETLVSVNADTVENDKLPLYSKAQAYTSTGDLRKLDFSVVTKPSAEMKAFTTVSSSLKLIPSTATVLESRGDLFIEVNGRDLACDLLSQSTVLSATSSGFVRISKEDSDEMNQFYNTSVSAAVKKVLANTTENAVKKSARLGFQFGKSIEDLPARYTEKQIDLQVGNLMDLLFTKDLTPTERVLRNNGAVVINVESGVEVEAVTLNLGAF